MALPLVEVVRRPHHEALEALIDEEPKGVEGQDGEHKDAEDQPGLVQEPTGLDGAVDGARRGLHVDVQGGVRRGGVGGAGFAARAVVVIGGAREGWGWGQRVLHVY